jgi:tRNA A-37 threonylcarbamoyl transferase component Bud32
MGSNNLIMDIYKKVYKKNYDRKNLNRYSNVHKTDAFKTEIECYKRLSRYQNFPKLIDFDEKTYSMNLEHCGQVLGSDVKSKEIKIPTILNFEEQIYNIWNALTTENIINLDIQLKNFTYKNDILYLIDFDIAAVDMIFNSKEIEEMYKKQKSNLEIYENFEIFIKKMFNK